MPDIKRSPMDTYYRAYREYTDSMKAVSQFGNFKSSLRNSSKKENDTFSGSIAHREIDLEWVEAIEYAIPYIDKAIREQRRFIAQTEEVVPIEKSKKVTTESVRHLAQHTNLIGKVEGTNVTPKSILNIQREESFDIYENRFLRTLICRAIDFVGRCYAQIKDTPESSVASICMARDSAVDNQVFNVELRCDLEYSETDREFSVDEDVSGLTEFERIIRLRKILSDFLAAPLIRGLSGCPAVRSPITRTNLLVKDQNFREVLKLWDFFDRYSKVGFTLVTEDNPDKMKPCMQEGVYDALTLLQFVIRMNLSNGMRAVLEENYLRENELLELERQREEEARERAVQERIAAALAEQKAEYEQKLDEAEQRRVRELKELDDSWNLKYTTAVSEYETRLAEAEERRVNELKALEDSWSSKYANTVSDYENKIDMLEKAHISEIEDLKLKHRQEKTNLTEHYESVISVKDFRHTYELSEKAKYYQEYIDQLKTLNSRDIENMTAEFNEKLDAAEEEKLQIRKDADAEIDELTETFETEKEMLVEAAIKKRKAEAEARYAKLSAKYDKLSKELETRKDGLAAADEIIGELRQELKNEHKKLAEVTAERDSNAKLAKSLKESYDRELERKEAKFAKALQHRNENAQRKIDRLNRRIEVLNAKLAGAEDKPDEK